MALMKKQPSISGSTAEVVDGCLVLSCPNAIQPVVWRMEIDKIGTASFEVKVNEKDNTAKLVLKPKKGTAELIAGFETKEAAVNALMATSEAMQSSTVSSSKKVSKKQNSNDSVENNQKSFSPKFVVILTALVIVIGLYVYMTSLIPERSSLGSQSSSTSSASSPQNSTGVPVSADDFLKGL